MVDPLSIATGVAGLLSSITSMSIQMNELRNDFVEAKAEIDTFLRELEDLASVLTRLRNSQETLRLPNDLTRDLGRILKNCDRHAEDTEAMLLKSSLKSLRGAYWAFAGKRKFLELCRGLESHKATINIILNLGSVHNSSQLLDRMDRFLSDITETRQHLSGKEYILHRFLEDTEAYAQTICEHLTATDVDVDNPFQDDQRDRNDRESISSMSSKNENAFTETNENRVYKSEYLHRRLSNDSTIATFDFAHHDDKEISHAQYGALRTLDGHESGISSVKFSKSGNRLLSGSWDGTLRLWDVEAGLAVSSLHGHSDDVTSVTFVGYSGRLASASCDKTIRIWDGQTALQIHKLEGHTDRISSIAYETQNGLLASASLDRTIRIWDVTIGSSLTTLSPNYGVWSVALAEDGKQLISGSDNGTITIWDLRTHAASRTLKGHIDGVWSLASSRDRLASGSWDHTVRIWDLRVGAATQVLQGHDEYVASVVFMGDKWLASGSGNDQKINLWDIHDGSIVQTLTTGGGSVSSIAFSDNDGGILASGLGDNTIRLWQPKET